MNCPQCKLFVPDMNYKCPHCGKVLRDLDPTDFRPQDPGEKTNRNPLGLILGVIALIAIVFIVYAGFLKEKNKAASSKDTTASSSIASTGTHTGNYEPGTVINKDNPGETIDISGYVQEGKMTIFDFYSEYCPPCRQIGPLLKQLDVKRDDIVVLKVDINRPGTHGIDWGSPVAKQYGLQSIPHFKIYNSSGEKESEGQDAYNKVMELLQNEGISFEP
jgi:thiol-disulfide isomerase/thioredoxin